eukprot:symbB.v1.2.031369.t1/scaffold3593.1/size53504/3
MSNWILQTESEGRWDVGVIKRCADAPKDSVLRHGYFACKRMTGTSPSPLLQMSYETTMQFLSTACQEGLFDNMASPASSIVLGKPPEVGTGIVNILVDLDPPAGGLDETR